MKLLILAALCALSHAAPCVCSTTWSDPESGTDGSCMNQKGCPAQPCDGEWVGEGAARGSWCITTEVFCDEALDGGGWAKCDGSAVFGEEDLAQDDENCKDEHDYCSAYAKYCAKEDWKEYMGETCKKTCGLCGAAGELEVADLSAQGTSDECFLPITDYYFAKYREKTDKSVYKAAYGAKLNALGVKSCGDFVKTCKSELTTLKSCLSRPALRGELSRRGFCETGVKTCAETAASKVDGDECDNGDGFIFNGDCCAVENIVWKSDWSMPEKCCSVQITEADPKCEQNSETAVSDRACVVENKSVFGGYKCCSGLKEKEITKFGFTYTKCVQSAESELASLLNELLKH